MKWKAHDFPLFFLKRYLWVHNSNALTICILCYGLQGIRNFVIEFRYEYTICLPEIEMLFYPFYLLYMFSNARRDFSKRTLLVVLNDCLVIIVKVLDEIINSNYPYCSHNLVLELVIFLNAKIFLSPCIQAYHM